VILRYRVSRPGKFPIPNCEVQCPAVSPKELRIGAVYCGLVRFTADRGGGFRTKPELEKQATLVYCGLLRMDKAPRQKPARGALTTNGTNHTKGRKLNHGFHGYHGSKLQTTGDANTRKETERLNRGRSSRIRRKGVVLLRKRITNGQITNGGEGVGGTIYPSTRQEPHFTGHF
jgi:hypothetical protein